MAPRPAGEPDKTTYRGRFAARLRELREAAGLSVETVAEAVGVSAKGYYHWEKGIRSPGFDDLPKLAKAVKAKSVAELFPNK